MPKYVIITSHVLDLPDDDAAERARYEFEYSQREKMAEFLTANDATTADLDGDMWYGGVSVSRLVDPSEAFA